MKKLFVVVLFVFLAAAGVFAQQKYALVIGNGAYAHITKLNNPVNDANDVAAALQGMGFTVDKVLNGTQEQMESAAIRLKNRLSTAKNSYGLLFYAGHGVQSGGENYLIPVDANIQSESFLRSRAVSVQAMLDELNEAGNELNVVVLDACRDNPFSWKRSGSRGLSVVGQQPADSIIVFATSAGSTAADGTGRNGLFTSNFLNNLKTPGLEVTEVFRRTMGDVARASNNEQRPAVYNQFSGLAYLGSRPTATVPTQPQPAPAPAPAPAPVQPDTAAAKASFDRGEAFRNRGEWDSAIREYTDAIRLNPNAALYYNNRGFVYYNKKDYDRAITDLSEAIRLDPNYTIAYNNRGNAYNDKKDDDRAIADYNEAIRLNPSYAFAYNGRGNVHMNHKKDYDRAIADYTQAIKFDPNLAVAYNQRGVAYYDGKKDYDRAIADFTQAIKLNPNYALAYNNRGNAYTVKGDTRKAKADYEKAKRLGYNP